MAPVTIAVDSFGPVTDNAQSVYELSRIESLPNISAEIEKDFGFKPDFDNAKLELEKGDGAGNTFKATAKPVLIGTAVVGATTMIFGIIMLLQNIVRTTQLQISSFEPGAAADHSRPAHGRRGDLLVHRRQHAGRRHRRLSRGRVHQETFNLDKADRLHRRQQRSRRNLHRLRAKRHDQHLHRGLFASRWACRFSTRISSSAISSASRSSVCSRPFSWPTPAAPGTTPRKSWKWI